jgi:hypothetical protein
VSSDIGAIAPGRWQLWQERWMMGAMSLVKVTLAPACPAAASRGEAAAASAAKPTNTPKDFHCQLDLTLIVATSSKPRGSKSRSNDG